MNAMAGMTSTVGLKGPMSPLINRAENFAGARPGFAAGRTRQRWLFVVWTSCFTVVRNPCAAPCPLTAWLW
jgi:hypothetical protein